MEILTTKQVAEFLHVGIDKVYKMKARGEIPFITIGGSIRYNKADLEAWLKAHSSGDANE